MLKDMNYNLLEEITKLSQALARFDKYVRDANENGVHCTECTSLWWDIRKHHMQDLDALLCHLAAHIDKGLVDFTCALPEIPPTAPRVP